MSRRAQQRPALPRPARPRLARPRPAPTRPARPRPAPTRPWQGGVLVGLGLLALFLHLVRDPAAGRALWGWQATVYYTAVEEFHPGPTVEVTGCLVLDCTQGRDDLGRYRGSFVDAVRAEGTGRTLDGQFLNWSYDVGYWLDDTARDTAGRRLRPFESAAADPAVLAAGTHFGLVTCGRGEADEVIPGPVCARLTTARWTVVDEFTPGLGGDRHVDLYIGEETGPGFTDGAWYTTLIGAGLRID